MFKFWQRKPKADPKDGRIEILESIRIKREMAEEILEKLSNIERRFHKIPVIDERRSPVS